MKLIITGATGNAGSGILAAALACPQVSEVTVLSRRPVPISHSKLAVILLPSADYPSGFDTCSPELVERLRGHSAIIWALAGNQAKMSKEEYVKVTHDYTLNFGKALSALGTADKPFKFIFISGGGAGLSEKALQLAETESFMTVSISPGRIIPTAEHSAHMGILTATALRTMGAIFGVLWLSMVISAADLGYATVRMATEDWGWDLKMEEGWIGNGSLVKAIPAAKIAQRDI
ncbi:uncharacterized protein MKK02DRAFT_45757 [Dioszegia hungarica]|uniref:NAD(P)-binding domain-containing protein n=1 Tax=Dioszegia hungarica TaxID=4972 RepID=A0AA38LTL3_9TREE|nr:uncharacterized protein MKK02DRAFT_45757 [Dioszegia hungarica]KAI9637047.1 hypothetical protein MKK02DRAFT_45757 [Dioszegia hungarica]